MEYFTKDEQEQLEVAIRWCIDNAIDTIIATHDVRNMPDEEVLTLLKAEGKRQFMELYEKAKAAFETATACGTKVGTSRDQTRKNG